MKFNGLSESDKISALKLYSAIRYWISNDYAPETAAQQLLTRAAAIPSLARMLEPSKRKLNSAVRGDKRYRATRVVGGWKFPDYKIAGWGNMNSAKFFGNYYHGPKDTFYISGKDIISSAMIIDTEKASDWAQFKNEKWINRFIDSKFKSHVPSWATDWESVGGDESEIIVVSPVLKRFSLKEFDQGYSVNCKQCAEGSSER